MKQWRQFSFKPPHLASLLINVFLWSHLGRQGHDKGHEETGGHDWVVEAWLERKRRMNRWNNGREFRITPQRCTLSIGRRYKNKVTNNRGNMKKSPPKHWSWWGCQVENSTWEALAAHFVEQRKEKATERQVIWNCSSQRSKQWKRMRNEGGPYGSSSRGKYVQAKRKKQTFSIKRRQSKRHSKNVTPGLITLP